MQDQTFMKERPVLPLLLSMGIPMIISLVAGALYNIVDSIFVSMISEDAMTALSLVYPVQNLAHAAGVGFGVGINAQIARLLGEGKRREAERSASQGLFLGAVHGLVIMAAGMAGIGAFLRMYTDSETVLACGLEYFHVVFLFSVADNLGMTLEKIYQSLGKMMVSMFCVLLGCGFNIVLDPLLIFGLGPFPEMGIRGAALATGLGQVLSVAAYAVIYRHSPPGLALRVRDMRPTWKICRNMYSVGVASSLNLALASVMISGLNAILAPFSQVCVLVLGVYYRLQSLLYQAACGLVLGMRPLISYNYGAGERERVRRIYGSAMAVVAVIMLAGTLACQLAPAALMGLFTENAETVAAGETALRIVSCGFIVSSVSVVTSGALEGLGRGPASLAIALLRYVVVILPAAFILSRLLGPEGVWHAFWIAELATAAASLLIWRRRE